MAAARQTRMLRNAAPPRPPLPPVAPRTHHAAARGAAATAARAAGQPADVTPEVLLGLEERIASGGLASTSGAAEEAPAALIVPRTRARLRGAAPGAPGFLSPAAAAAPGGGAATATRGPSAGLLARLGLARLPPGPSADALLLEVRPRPHSLA